MFGNIPRNVWGHSPEYNIPPIPRVSRIPFPVPVFLVLYIADKYHLITSSKTPVGIEVSNITIMSEEKVNNFWEFTQITDETWSFIAEIWNTE